MRRRRKAVKARLISNVYKVEIEKMRVAGWGYRRIAQELSKRHRRHFSVGWVWTCYQNSSRASQTRKQVRFYR
jgi:hypothetical protein